MNARSLVGMTMRARRDAARQLAVGQVVTVPPRLAFAGHKGPIERIRWPYVEVRMTDGITNSIHIRDLMRIGERLRPCPGCYRCAERYANTDLELWSPYWPVCDGGGVLPARRAR